jgi:hypothetical protein
MISRSRVNAGIPFVFWILAVITIAVLAMRPGYVVGWDLDVYRQAVLSLRAGHDPYLACVAARKMYFDHLAAHPLAPRPFGYIYPPITLPFLQMLSKWHMLTVGVVYWAMYAIGVMVVLWASRFSIRKNEWTAFSLLAPASLFFPGFLQSDPLFSGNVAYILYGTIFAGAGVGWRTGKWRWFYVAVLVASLIKPTFLSLLGIPVFTAACQWLPALATAALSLCCNVLQEPFWPVQFGNYRMSLQSQVVDYIHDFGLHPAGVLADALYDKVPYRITFVLLYGVCTVLFGGALLHLRGRFLRGEISLKDWIPVVLIGVTFLNPRIMQYDLLPVTLPMALVGWRFFHRWFGDCRPAVITMFVFFVVLNVAGNFAWAPTECLLLVGLFLAGTWTLLHGVSVKAAEPSYISDPLKVYLHDHFAGAGLMITLLEELLNKGLDEPLSHVLSALLAEVTEDRAALKTLADDANPGTSKVKAIAAWVGEKLSRFKLGGADSDGFEIFEALEVVELGIRGKRQLWRTLDVASEADVRLRVLDYEKLISRADRQYERVEERRLALVRSALTKPSYEAADSGIKKVA